MVSGREHHVTLKFPVVGGAVGAWWMTDRLFEAGVEPTTTASVAMQAAPLVTIVGASFFVGIAAIVMKGITAIGIDNRCVA